jgi:hypothetical protein
MRLHCLVGLSLDMWSSLTQAEKACLPAEACLPVAASPRVTASQLQFYKYAGLGMS